MFQLLTKYLLQFKKLVVPGIGVFTVETKDAVSDFTTQVVEAPGWVVLFSGLTGNAAEDKAPDDAVALEHLYDWLTGQLHISKEDAILKLDEFSDEIKEKLDNGQIVDWEGLGKLEKKEETIIFTGDESAMSPYTPVTAKKVLRENASHSMLVGEKETTSEEMRAQLHREPEVTRSTAMRIAWILFFIALVLLAVYFLRNGCNTASMGNREKVESTKSPETYQLR